MDAILKLEGIGKMFGGNYVLKNVSLEIGRGEVHAIIGENGAGKSTLMKIIGGIYEPNEGSMWKNGEKTVLHNAIDAYKHGIGIVHQELSVADNLTIAENIFAGRQPVNRLGFVREKKMCEDAGKILEDMGIRLNPREVVGNLSVAMQQVIEIAKVVSHNIDVLILDEPTSSLSNHEIDHLFELVRRLCRERGMTVIFISHKLGEIMEISDRVSVLRNGNFIGTLSGDEITASRMIRMMVGDELDSRSFLAPESPEGEIILRAEKLCRTGKFRNVSFDLQKNRILGVFGLIGAGRTESVLSLIGADKLDSGEIIYEGKKARFSSPKEAIARGIAYLTENRRDLGLFLPKGISDNIIAASLEDFTTKGHMVDCRKTEKVTKEYIQRLKIQPPAMDKPAGTYSGGNQQKILFSKVLLTNPKVLIVDEPTRGVDIGVKMTIHHMLRELADTGIAVLLISSELPEILKLSDRVLVMHEGVCKGILENKNLTEQEVMAAVYSKQEVQE